MSLIHTTILWSILVWSGVAVFPQLGSLARILPRHPLIWLNNQRWILSDRPSPQYRTLFTDDALRPLPPIKETVGLFIRPMGQSCERDPSKPLFFTWLTNWLINTFLKTNHHDMTINDFHDTNFRMPIYGRDDDHLDCLRTHKGGRLKDGPKGGPPLVRCGVKQMNPHSDHNTWDSGIPHGNANPGLWVMESLMLQTHNKIADALDHLKEEPRFEAARAGTRLIHHHHAFEFVFSTNPTQPILAPTSKPFLSPYAWKTKPYEFNLLYQWHGMIPDTINGVAFDEYAFRPSNVIKKSFKEWIHIGMNETACKQTLHNTPQSFAFLERHAIEQSRAIGVARFNAVRRQMGLRPFTSFEEFGGHAEDLRRVYHHVDNVELYAGSFAYDGVNTFGEMTETILVTIGYDIAANGIGEARQRLDELGVDTAFLSKPLESIDAWVHWLLPEVKEQVRLTQPTFLERHIAAIDLDGDGEITMLENDRFLKQLGLPLDRRVQQHMYIYGMCSGMTKFREKNTLVGENFLQDIVVSFRERSLITPVQTMNVASCRHVCGTGIFTPTGDFNRSRIHELMDVFDGNSDQCLSREEMTRMNTERCPPSTPGFFAAAVQAGEYGDLVRMLNPPNDDCVLPLEAWIDLGQGTLFTKLQKGRTYFEHW